MSIYYVGVFPYSDDLYHHGTKGQKWGVRKYQNVDGSLTQAGKDRYLKGYDFDSDKTNQNGSQFQTSSSKSPAAKAESGRQFAESMLSSSEVKPIAGSQASTVADGKASLYKKFGSFTVLKNTNGVTSESIKKALDKKRADEEKASKSTTDSSKSTSETSDKQTSSTKSSSKKSVSTKKSSSTKKASTKKTASKKTASKKTSSKKSSSTKSSKTSASSKAQVSSTNNAAQTIVSRRRSTSRARHLETAGTGASKKNTIDFLKQYRIKAR